MIIANILGLVLIAWIVWWFWLYKPAEVATQQGEAITVQVENGVYLPARIRVPANTASVLRFIRKDPSPCAETVVFADLGISESLPLGESRDIAIGPLAPGHYAFACQMQMYRGELVVE